jgi:cytochrome d ubiquinol oxidase subunit I
MVLACYVGVGFAVATVYAVAMLRGKRDEYHRKAMLLGLTVGLIAITLQMIVGDAIARSLETQQPLKLAAMEAVYDTSTHVPLYLMGIPNVPQQAWYTNGLVIPDGLSLLVGFSPDTNVIGLVSWLKLGDVVANGFHPPGDISAESRVFWFAQPSR